ncbi:MAG: glycosyltransferase [Alcanivoracaceae bacterium]|nr:glycosyltransferase [Alcanivoracaceae bacterium]
MNNKTLNVLFVMDALSQRNGVGSYYHDLVAQLSERVDRVELVAPSLQSPHPCQGIALPMPGDDTQQLYLPRLRQLTHAIREQRPDVMVVPGPGVFSIVAQWIARREGIPVCVIHQTDYDRLAGLYYGGWRGRFFAVLMRALTRMMFRQASAVATISEMLRDQMRRLGAAGARVLATPLARQFVQTPRPARFDHLERLLFVGRLAPEKNLPAVLDLARARPDIEVAIAGDGPLRACVEEAARELANLRFHGWCDRDRVRDLMDDSQVLLLPSRVEAFGTVALEAMARGRLVLTAPGCGINAWPGMTSAIWPQREGESLAGCLARLEQLSPAQRLLRANRGRQLALAVNEQAMQQWLQLLQYATSRRSTLPTPMSAVYALLRRMADQRA